MLFPFRQRERYRGRGATAYPAVPSPAQPQPAQRFNLPLGTRSPFFCYVDQDVVCIFESFRTLMCGQTPSEPAHCDNRRWGSPKWGRLVSFFIRSIISSGSVRAETGACGSIEVTPSSTSHPTKCEPPQPTSAVVCVDGSCGVRGLLPFLGSSALGEFQYFTGSHDLTRSSRYPSAWYRRLWGSAYASRGVLAFATPEHALRSSGRSVSSPVRA
jgi:hypothetical protein